LVTRRKLLAQIPAATRQCQVTSCNLAKNVLFVNSIVLLKKRTQADELA